MVKQAPNERVGYFGDNLRLIRGYLNLTQEQLGEKIGLSRQQIYRYESKIAMIPPSDVLKKTADLIDIPMVRLLYTALKKEDFYVADQ